MNTALTLTAAAVVSIVGHASAGAGSLFPPVIELSSLDGSNGFVLNGIDANDFSGSVSSAGDVNADGVDDLIIGALLADPNGTSGAGESYVVFGRTPEVSPCVADIDGGGGVDFDDFVILTGQFGQSGADCPCTADVDGDGDVDFDDFVILTGEFGRTDCP